MSLTPVHVFSHGSTRMMVPETTSATYWATCGKEALANNVKGVIIMGAHWDFKGDKLEVATNPAPSKTPCPFTNPDLWVDWKPNPDIPTAERCIKALAAEGFSVSGNSTTPWHHDVFIPLVRMFPDSSKCPPTVVLSSNSRYDPHYHIKIGATLRFLRKEGFMLVGTGGAVHNLYRNTWSDVVQNRDTLGQESPPAAWALDFRQAVEDVITQTSGPRLRAGVARLMKHPLYREAHASDDHFIPTLFAAGAAGDWEDIGTTNILGAETWELTHMCNSQYTFGAWGDTPQAVAAH
ncbi:hypothetical protein LTS09_017852 [Friedmanniomyces endolithicus]|nr:hypothetical protein LTS09_017852 [Friedmanniomyces endolithicus]